MIKGKWINGFGVASSLRLQLGPKLAVAIFMLFKPYCVTAKNVTGVYYD
ncbi:hypothetical protein [Lactobacillus sp. ESL0225]|nr:hypothetical protein [Lactobacillus sp. ESL0225]